MYIFAEWPERQGWVDTSFCWLPELLENPEEWFNAMEFTWKAQWPNRKCGGLFIL